MCVHSNSNTTGDSWHTLPFPSLPFAPSPSFVRVSGSVKFRELRLAIKKRKVKKPPPGAPCFISVSGWLRAGMSQAEQVRIRGATTATVPTTTGRPHHHYSTTTRPPATATIFGGLLICGVFFITRHVTLSRIQARSIKAGNAGLSRVVSGNFSLDALPLAAEKSSYIQIPWSFGRHPGDMIHKMRVPTGTRLALQPCHQ